MNETLALQIVALYREFSAYTTRELKKVGLGLGQMPFLLYVGKHPGCTQAELTRSLELDWGHSQRSITRLAREGFLLREFQAEQNANCLTLLEKGQEAFALCHQVFETWDRQKLEGVPEEEQAQLLALLRRLRWGAGEDGGCR